MYDSFIRPRRISSSILAILIAAVIHCAVWVVFSADLPNAPVQNQGAIQKPLSILVYLQPVLTRPRDIPDGRGLSPEKPRVASSRSPKREQKIDDTKQDTETHDTQLEKLASVNAAATNMPSADISGETSSRLNIDELKEFARRDTKEQGKTLTGQNIKISELKHSSSEAEQQAIARAQRPKCDNDYKPKVGSLEFSGLMKLPFLLKGAMSDRGCKW